MRLTQHVHRDRSSSILFRVSLGILMAGLTSIVAVCGASRQLDTRTLEAKGAYAIHGVGMMTHRSWPALELEVELKDVSPRTANISDELLVEMILRNPTDHTVWIPSSKDFNEIMKPDVVGRRAMHFSILISGLTGFDDLPSSYFTSDSVTIGAEGLRGLDAFALPCRVLTVKPAPNYSRIRRAARPLAAESDNWTGYRQSSSASYREHN